MVQALSQIQEIDREADAARERQLFYCWCARRSLERVLNPHPDLLAAVDRSANVMAVSMATTALGKDDAMDEVLQMCTHAYAKAMGDKQ